MYGKQISQKEKLIWADKHHVNTPILTSRSPHLSREEEKFSCQSCIGDEPRDLFNLCALDGRWSGIEPMTWEAEEEQMRSKGLHCLRVEDPEL